MDKQRIEVLKEGRAGDTYLIARLPGKFEIPAHPFVTIYANVGKVKYLSDRMIIADGRAIHIEVSRKYKGPPITLFAEEILEDAAS